MRYEEELQLRRDLELWSLNSMGATRLLRDLKDRVIVACSLDPSQIEALPDEPIGLLDALKNYMDDSLDE